MNKPNLEPWEKDTIYGAFVILNYHLSVLWGNILCAFGIHDWRNIKSIVNRTKYNGVEILRPRMRLCKRCPKQQRYDPF